MQAITQHPSPAPLPVPSIAPAPVGAPSRETNYLHAVLCQLGLPRRRTEARRFERRDGKSAVLLEAGESFDGKCYRPQPLPYGPMARLITINVCTTAVVTRKRQIELGHSTREFMRRLNVTEQGRTMRILRKQMLAFSVTKMTLGYLASDGTIHQRFCPPVEAFQAWLIDEARQRSLWPGVLELSKTFQETLLEYAVPLDPEALAQLQDSSLALDGYTWMAHRLHRVRQSAGEFLSWGNLHDQFGTEYGGKRCLNDFQKRFKPALQRALKAYPEARLEFMTGGIKIFPSPPPIRKSQTAGKRANKVPVTAAGVPHVYRLIDNRSAYAQAYDRAKELGVSAATVDGIDDIAPHWDKQLLMNRYYMHLATSKKEPGTNPNAAYRGWVGKFTKGKSPS